jgi:hypothetical protein
MSFGIPSKVSANQTRYLSPIARLRSGVLKSSYHEAKSFIRRFLIQSRNSPHFTETLVSMLLPQGYITYPQPHKSRTCITCKFFNTHCNIIIPSTPRFSKWPLSSRLPNKILLIFSVMRATFPAHLYVCYLILVEA